MMPAQAGGEKNPRMRLPGPMRVGLFVAMGIFGLVILFGVSVSKSLDPGIVKKPPASMVCRDSRAGAQFVIRVNEYQELPLSEIPRIVRDAFLSVYDSRIFTHKKAKADFDAGLEGTENSFLNPTMTMNLAHNALAFHLRDMPSMIEEIILAAKIRRHYSKEERLQLFLNRLYFGRGIFGVEGAARHFFGKSVSQLELHEVALLVGQSHERLNSWTLPRSSRLTDPNFALMRRDAVLDAMAECGAITDKQAVDAKQTPLGWLEH